MATATKLNQIVAVEKGVKGKSNREFTEIYHTIQKAPLLSGIVRTYQPKDEEGDHLPSESTLVQVKVENTLTYLADTLTRLFDVTLTKDATNCVAKADVTVDGQTILSDVPVTYLLFLEKQLTDLHTFAAKLPTLDPAETWEYNSATGTFATTPTLTTRTKKIPRNHVKAAATDKHPAQVEIYHEDVIVGTWTTIKFSGALPQDRVNDILARVEKLSTAVKFAREEANNTEVVDRKAGESIFGYLFAP